MSNNNNNDDNNNNSRSSGNDNMGGGEGQNQRGGRGSNHGVRGRSIGRAYAQATGRGGGNAGGQRGRGRVMAPTNRGSWSGIGRGVGHGSDGGGHGIVHVPDTHARPPLNEQSRLVEVDTYQGQMPYLSTTDALHQRVRDIQSIPGVPRDAVWEVTYTYRGLQQLVPAVQIDAMEARQRIIREPQLLPMSGVSTQLQQPQQQQLHDRGSQADRTFFRQQQQLPRRVPAANPSSGSGFAGTQPARPRGVRRRRRRRRRRGPATRNEDAATV
ncbi:hypothetical protein V2A60_001120 [Cordyceps javanica]